MTPSLLQDLASGETVAKDLLLLGSRAQPQNNQAAGSQGLQNGDQEREYQASW